MKAFQAIKQLKIVAPKLDAEAEGEWTHVRN